jgi:hypothetical protein
MRYQGPVMRRLSKLSIVAGAAGVMALAPGAAQRPAALSQSQSGMWELSGLPGAASPTRVCLADPVLFAQFEHRRAACTRVVLRDLPGEAEVHYTCPGGGFGRTTITVLTPRSLRVETQGISANAPFHYVLDARRTGKCETH